MKKIYIQPNVVIEQVQSLSLMQVASPTGVVGNSGAGTEVIGVPITPETPLIGN